MGYGKVVSTVHTCSFHRRAPGKPYAWCTCGGSVSLVAWTEGAPEKLDAESLERIRAIGATVKP